MTSMTLGSLQVFLLIGQSNMSGRGELLELPPMRHPNILMFRAGKWQEAEEPLHTDRPTASAGLGMSFAARLLEAYPQARIGLVPCAVGGTPLSRWLPGADLYEEAVRTTRQALKAGELKGVLWHQGENDSERVGDTASYGERFGLMVAALREELAAPDAPVVAGELGRFRNNPEIAENTARINDALNALRSSLPLYGCASSVGLRDKGDALHFGAVALREFGVRYAEVYLGLLEHPLETPS